MHIENLYKNQDILMFRECYALEKIHGTSAHVSYAKGEGVKFFAGGSKHETFVAIFDQVKLTAAFEALGHEQVVVFGEAYGGKLQGMSATYGKELKFIAFDVKIGETWLSVPDAVDVTKGLGLEFVDYVKITTDLPAIDVERDKPSTQAIRNGCGTDKIREGVILRPLFETRKNNGERIIAKHKRIEFSETRTTREVTDPEKLKKLSDAKAIAVEWVTPNRLAHVLDKIPAEKQTMENMRLIIDAMIEDVTREGIGEILDNKDTRQAIAGRTAQMFKIRAMEVKTPLEERR